MLDDLTPEEQEEYKKRMEETDWYEKLVKDPSLYESETRDSFKLPEY